MPKASKRGSTAPSLEDGAIVVTSQQSRYALDAVDAPTSKDVDVRDLTLTVGGRDLLDHVHLHLVEGVHYVLAGRNGTGKSSLLRALAERRVPGVPSNLRLLLLGQTRVSSDAVTVPLETPDDSLSILEYVTKSDRRRERALREANMLAAVLEDKADVKATVSPVRILQLEKAKQNLAEAQLIAARRSGARGSKARQVLIEREKAVEEAEKRLQDIATAEDELEATKIGLDFLEATRMVLEAMDAGGTEARARTILVGLRFSETQIEQPVKALSGGWQTRCDLACALIQKTDVLMLDEPTNFLDLPAIIWLERYITKSLSGTTVVVVSHDRDFVDAIASQMLLVRLAPAKTLEVFKGNLSEYENEKHRQIRRMTKMAEAHEKQTDHIRETIAGNMKAAKRTGDDKKLKQAASRKKKLEERSGLEVGLSGGRFKINRDLGGYHTTKRATIDIPEFDPPVTITLPDQPEPLRHAGPLFSFEKVSYTYPKSGVWTLKEIDLVMHPGERLGLAGLNGSGKSTLVKLLMGATSGGDGLRPTKGSVTVHSRARVNCYSQHAVEELEIVGRTAPERTALSYLMQLPNWNGDEQTARTTLAKLGLRGNVVTDIPLAALSGGQRVRVALAEACINSPHLLVMDEVTTHLDADTIDALIEALKSWQGALLVVTHDRHYMRCVVDREKPVRPGNDEDDSDSEDLNESAVPGTVYHVRKSGIRKLERGMQQYEEIVQKTVDKLGS